MNDRSDPEMQSIARCRICGKPHPLDEMMPGDLIHGPLVDLIRRDFPDFSDTDRVCPHDLKRYRTEHLEALIEADRGELSELELGVLRSLEEHEITARDVNAQFERELTFGERLSDRIAEVGGSWRFIIGFGFVLVVWIIINTIVLVERSFDPYPFILLNLVLSCIAAIQAPIIMMSQNRQEAKDRLRGEHDYRVNLKAELEVRNLNAKIDLLLTHQWRRLLEIQRIQTEMMEEILLRSGARAAGGTTDVLRGDTSGSADTAMNSPG